MRTVLVTGGAGFVGANLVRRLVTDGHRVHVLIRGETDKWRLADITDDIRWHPVNLAVSADVDVLLASVRPEWIFHLAAHGQSSTQNDVPRMVDTNYLATTVLLTVALRHGFEAFIHAGSSSEYGWKNDAPDEQTWLDPNSFYAVTKAAATIYCRYASLRTGSRITTLRLYSVFGPYEEPARLIPTLLTHAMRKRLPPLVDPSVCRDFVYVDDVTEAFLRAASREQPCGAVYNVGTGHQTSLQSLVGAVRSLFGVDAEPVWGSMPNRSWDTTSWVANPTRIERELGWRPNTTLADGLRSFANWLREQPAGIRGRYESGMRFA